MCIPSSPDHAPAPQRLADRGEPFALAYETPDPLTPTPPILNTDEAAEVAALLAQLNPDADEDAPTYDDERGPEVAQRLSVYQEITDLLVARGIPRAEIAWIHDAKTPSDREALFGQMRSGALRVLLGSTFRMGVGVNVQERCYAVHHLTTPWRPCDVKQADGRIWRPGNLFPEIWIFRYIAAPSFDGFSWQGIETKGKFEDAYLRGDPSVRVMSDIDEQIISAGEIKALASGDPRIVQKVRLEHELEKLKQQRDGWEGTRRTARHKVLLLEQDAATLRDRARTIQAAIDRRSAAQTLVLFETPYDLTADSKAIGKTLRDALIAWGTSQSLTELKRLGRLTARAGSYRDLPLFVRLELDSHGKVKLPTLLLATDNGERLSDATIYIGDRAEIVTRMEQAATDLDRAYARAEAEAARISTDAARIRATLEEPWEHARTARLMELGLRYLNAALNEDTAATERVIAEVLALAESEGLDIEAIIKEGQAIEEQGVDLAQIRMQLPPLSMAVATPHTLDMTERHAVAPPAPRADSPPAASHPTIPLSRFADPRPIARPTLEVATLDLTELATEAARKRAEIATKKRRQALDAGQTSFLSC